MERCTALFERGVSRARWLTELAIALDAADRAARVLGYGAHPVEAIVLRARIATLRAEVDALIHAFEPAPDIPPHWFN